MNNKTLSRPRSSAIDIDYDEYFGTKGVDMDFLGDEHPAFGSLSTDDDEKCICSEDAFKKKQEPSKLPIDRASAVKTPKIRKHSKIGASTPQPTKKVSYKEEELPKEKVSLKWFGGETELF